MARDLLNLAFYGNLFLGVADDNGDELDILSDDNVTFLDAIEEEIVQEGALEETKGFSRVPARLARLAAYLDQKFGLASRLLFYRDLVQVRRFQHEFLLRASVLERVPRH